MGEVKSRLTLIRDKVEKHNGVWKSLYRCACGNEKLINRHNVWYGKVVSCGCFRDERRVEAKQTHGYSGTRVYTVWSTMKARCLNPNSNKYMDYGARGITVCDHWRQFENFLADMGLPPSDNHSIERVNNNGNYELSNCRWALPSEQANNKRNNRLFEFNGERKSLKGWADCLGMNHRTLASRLYNYEWPAHKAFTEPVKKKKEKK